MFQAGDMNRSDQLKRAGIYVTKRNTREKHCKKHYEVVRDCILNQFDDCDRKERECDFGIFEAEEKEDIGKLKMPDYIQLYEEYPDYRNCYNCKQYDEHRLGVPWIRPVEECNLLLEDEAVKALTRYAKKYKGRFKLATYPNGTLSFDIANQKLDYWEEEEDFVADILELDYIDIMINSWATKLDFRHRENEKWKEARRLSQTPRQGIFPLVIAPTQADSKSYAQDTLQLSNFNEDKRKYGHVTAFYGMNQNRNGTEKSLGLLRLNELIMREDGFDASNQVTLIQNLRQGRPVKGSFFKG